MSLHTTTVPKVTNLTGQIRDMDSDPPQASNPNSVASPMKIPLNSLTSSKTFTNTSLYRAFNKDAQPFVPSQANPNYLPAYGSPMTSVPASTTGSIPETSPLSSVLIIIGNIPVQMHQLDVEALIDEVLEPESNSESVELKFNVSSMHPSTVEDTCQCTVEIYGEQDAIELVERIDGIDVDGHVLTAQIVTPQHPGMPYYNYMGYYYPMTPMAMATAGPVPGVAPFVQPPRGMMPYPGFPPFMAPFSPNYGAMPYHGRADLTPDLAPQSSRSLMSSTSSSSITPKSVKPNGVPPFLLNLVNRSLENASPELIEVNDDDGNSIKVNACRLFVGNIPFSLTWSGLRNFLVQKCAEYEPENYIEILKVEIPMHSAPATGSRSTSRYGLFLGLFTKDDLVEIDEMEVSSSNLLSPQPYQRNLSRGFAIVTTGNRESSEKIIKYFDGVEFEGRNLTVRFDKFPEFNNYVLQQLYPGHNKDKTLTNLAFERNSIQHKFYYGSPMDQFQGRSHSMGHLYSGYGYQPRRNSYQHNSHQSSHQSPRFPVVQPNFVPQIHPLTRYTNNLNTHRSAKRKLESSETLNDNLDEDEKARQLVNSFKLLGVSSR